MFKDSFLAFDEIISGTAGTWYTSASYNRAIGESGFYSIVGVATDVSGTPTLTVTGEHSFDGRHWKDVVGAPEINAASVAEGAGIGGTMNAFAFWSLGGHGRFKITLGGTSPKCRLKLYVALRDS